MSQYFSMGLIFVDFQAMNEGIIVDKTTISLGYSSTLYFYPVFWKFPSVSSLHFRIPPALPFPQAVTGWSYFKLSLALFTSPFLPHSPGESRLIDLTENADLLLPSTGGYINERPNREQQRLFLCVKLGHDTFVFFYCSSKKRLGDKIQILKVKETIFPVGILKNKLWYSRWGNPQGEFVMG